DDCERLVQRWAPLPHTIVERVALQPLHDEVAASVGETAEAEDVDDVRVADGVDRARLEDEALDEPGVERQGRVHDFDGGLLADERMRSTVDRRHAAVAELAIDRVLADDGAGG